MKNLIPANWFEPWFNSPYYHILYDQRSEEEAAAFIDRLVAQLAPPADARLLDIACGKGRHSRQLAAKGFDVTGIDLASESIAYALQFENEHLHFYQQDMRNAFHSNAYDYAFNFFTSIGYFHTDQEDARTFSNFALALKPGGHLVIDFLNTHQAVRQLKAQQQLTKQGIVFDVRKEYDGKYFYKQIQVSDKDQHFTFYEKLRAFTLADFELLFNKNGLHIEQCFGDYALNKYDAASSSRLIIVAKKANKEH